MREPATPIEHLTTPADVAGFADEARAAGRIGLDTEFLWERTYAPVPCLVQVATANRIAIIDPIAGGDVTPIAALVADPDVEILMHAPAADLVLFARCFGIRPTRIFDVQVVAGFVGLGTSLAYDRLVERVLRIRLAHNETFSNWVKRPLSPTQIAYAADDVRHLHAIADALVHDVAARGRSAWVADELTRRYGPGVPAADPRQAYLKLSRRGRLSGRQLALLREVAAWREAEAQASDLPVGWVLKDPTVIEVARTIPRDSDAIGHVRGASGLSAPARARLVRAIEAGLAAEPIAPPREAPRELARRVAAASELAAVLLRTRSDAADIASELVATRADLERYVELVVAGGAEEHPLANGWRAELVGRELHDLVEGRLALASLPKPPYLDVIRRER
ncbi:MAG: HRDC domain-containing protein [Deltaproteobacteria bacterium]|nr:HRDC domain-containing protein [Deltaproteobacteria bacterium]